MTTGCDTRHTGCPPLYLKGYSTSWDNRTSILYPYMYSVLWRVIPMTVWWLRLPSVVFGLGIIVLTYLLARYLFPTIRFVPELSAIFTAISPTLIGWSRVGHDPITVPFFCLATVLAILATPRRPWLWVVAGGLLALGMYGYQPFKTTGPLIALLTVVYLRPRWGRRQVRWLIGGLLTGLAIGGPFLWNQIVNWSIVQQQFQNISVFHFYHNPLFLLWNLEQYAVALITQPSISLFIVPVLALLGWLILRKRNHREWWYTGLWALLGLIPVAITMWQAGDNSMQSRSLGVAGMSDILSAIGLVTIFQFAGRIKRRWLSWPLIGVLILIISISLVWTSWSNHNFNGGGFCCFVLGGMEKVAGVVQEPLYAQRPVVIDKLHFMQGMNLLWDMKIPPVDVQQASTRWESYGDTQLVTHVDRYTICDINVCYQPNDGALYVVPASKLTNLPTVATLTLRFLRKVSVWKIVDNAATK